MRRFEALILVHEELITYDSPILYMYKTKYSLPRNRSPNCGHPNEGIEAIASDPYCISKRARAKVHRCQHNVALVGDGVGIFKVTQLARNRILEWDAMQKICT